MTLTLVPPAPPDAKTALVERVKAAPRPAGTLQCPKCGGRTAMTLVTGSWIDKDGRYRRGTVDGDRICYFCDKKGILTHMMPPVYREVKLPKPRRTKLRKVE